MCRHVVDVTCCAAAVVVCFAKERLSLRRLFSASPCFISMRLSILLFLFSVSSIFISSLWLPPRRSSPSCWYKSCVPLEAWTRSIRGATEGNCSYLLERERERDREGGKEDVRRRFLFESALHRRLQWHTVMSFDSGCYSSTHLPIRPSPSPSR